jgi:MinD-like ATPase involved in chromosome partitioning or flagellar assembly
MTDEVPLGRIITFYSYKGGVGRSFALADVAVLLAAAGHRVLCVDWDLEAPGLSRYFQRWIPERPHDGLLEAILAFQTTPGATAAERHLVVEHPNTEGRLHLLPSGRMDPAYVQAVQKLSWDDLYAKGFGAWLEDLRDAWQWRYDFILIDARTGLSDTGGICTVELPHVLVVFTTPNDQSVEGTKQVIDAARAAHAALDRDRPALQVLPVATRIDDSEFERTEKWMTRMSDAFAKYLSEWSSEAEVDRDRAFRSLAVPYVPYWSYGEELPFDRDHAGDPRSVLAAHRNLARMLDPKSFIDTDFISTVPKVRTQDKRAFIICTNDQDAVVQEAIRILKAKKLHVTWEHDVPIGHQITRWTRDRLIASDFHFVVVGSGKLSPNAESARKGDVPPKAISGVESQMEVLSALFKPSWHGLIIPLFMEQYEPDETMIWSKGYKGISIPKIDSKNPTKLAETIESVMKKTQ